ncbi:MAG: hypothetical protein P1U56_12255 [Saprospiraceae bacterium]|nr:hypothetical protein [Saprospiraceae bacterium]
MVKGNVIVCLCFLGLILVSGCELMQKDQIKEGDLLLASVEDRRLYYSDIEGMLTPISEQDSISQLNNYIQAWISRNVVLNEAEKKFPQDVDIDKLIEDYRSSLLLHNYRQALIQKDLDTIITPSQEQEYYDKNKDQFLLADDICRARIIKISDKARRIERFYRNWQRNDTSAINKYIDENALFDSKVEDQNEWHSIEHYLSLLPENRFKTKDFSKKGDIQKHNDQFEYFVKVFECKSKNEVPPLSYVREQIRRVIINQRKKNLLDKIESNLYQTYLTSKKIKVHKN